MQKQLSITEKVLCVREGGAVLRCHTLPQHGTYNVAQHSYNALSLLLLLHPGHIRTELIKAVLWHDVPERWMGDIPKPAKWASTDLYQAEAVLEERLKKRIGIFKSLDKDDELWLGAVDLLELFLWVQEQRSLGNTNLMEMHHRIKDIFIDKKDSFPEPVIDFVRNYVYKRLPDCDNFLTEGEKE